MWFILLALILNLVLCYYTIPAVKKCIDGVWGLVSFSSKGLKQAKKEDVICVKCQAPIIVPPPAVIIPLPIAPVVPPIV